MQKKDYKVIPIVGGGIHGISFLKTNSYEKGGRKYQTYDFLVIEQSHDSNRLNVLEGCLNHTNSLNRLNVLEGT